VSGHSGQLPGITLTDDSPFPIKVAKAVASKAAPGSSRPTNKCTTGAVSPAGETLTCYIADIPVHGSVSVYLEENVPGTALLGMKYVNTASLVTSNPSELAGGVTKASSSIVIAQ
jgi:hypothetical protein